MMDLRLDCKNYSMNMYLNKTNIIKIKSLPMKNVQSAMKKFKPDQF